MILTTDNKRTEAKGEVKSVELRFSSGTAYAKLWCLLHCGTAQKEKQQNYPSEHIGVCGKVYSISILSH